LADRNEDAVGKVVGGLILCGIAMAFSGLSRPASGQEHYFSHMWEMMDLDRGNESELHGIQVGVGTILTLKVLDWLRNIKPDCDVAQTMMNGFRQEAWREQVKRIFGKAAPVIIESEEMRYHKNLPERHAEHLQTILANWDNLLSIMQKELPGTQTLIDQMRKLNMPVTPAHIGISYQDVQDAWLGSREIRDKYLCSSLAWDLGLMDVAIKVLLNT
jgi:glycerol-1-phosphate dehydrogenase [NAD(P)+]